MSGNTEPTSNSMKFTPVPISQLLANLKPIQGFGSADSSYTSLDDSEDSFLAETVVKTPSSKSPKDTNLHLNDVKNHVLNSTSKSGLQSCNNKIFAYDNKYNHKIHEKENSSSKNLSNRTYPNKDHVNSIQRSLVKEGPKSEVKKRTVLTPHQLSNIKTESARKQTPDINKGSYSSQKQKPRTPVIKSGLRKYTPGSGRRSHKKTPPKLPLIKNGESVKCKF